MGGVHEPDLEMVILSFKWVHYSDRKLPFLDLSMIPEISSLFASPDITNAIFVAANATVLGSVTLAPGSSVWYGAVLRGDVASIQVGENTNIQDGAVIHCDRGEPTQLDDHVTVGHRAVIHSAHIESGCLIGIGAIILNGVCIGSGSIIGAGAVVTKSVPARSLVMGVPGKIVREVTPQQAADLIEHARSYVQLAQVHADSGR